MFPSSDILVLADIPSFLALTNFRTLFCKKFFNMEGGAVDFDKRIKDL